MGSEARGLWCSSSLAENWPVARNVNTANSLDDREMIDRDLGSTKSTSDRNQTVLNCWLALYVVTCQLSLFFWGSTESTSDGNQTALNCWLAPYVVNSLIFLRGFQTFLFSSFGSYFPFFPLVHLNHCICECW